MTPDEQDKQTAELVDLLRRASVAIYITVERNVAEELSRMMTAAANEIVRLQQSRDYAVRDVVRGAEKVAALRAAYGGKDPE